MILQSKPKQDCPPGIWLGEISAIKVPNRQKKGLPCVDQVQINAWVETDDGCFPVYNIFCSDLSEGSPLTKLLRQWLGDKYEELLDQHGQLDMDKLIGRNAKVEVVHRLLPPYTSPHVSFSRLLPPED